MDGPEHLFDWERLRFIIGALVCLIVLFWGWLFGLPYVESYISSDSGKATVTAIEDQQLVPVAQAATLSTTTPQRILNELTIADTVPASGKFIAADLVHMELFLYQDGTTTAEYPILTKGKPGTPYETPSGVYAVLTKEVDHYNGGERVHMPYSMEFYGNYFIHGWPTYNDGSPVASTYSGGCIRLKTEDAAKVYAFADKGTGIFVYDTGAATSAPQLLLSNTSVPAVSAPAYVVADIDTGDVYAEQDGESVRPISSVTKLMTALVTNETIMFDRKVSVPRSVLQDTDTSDSTPATFAVGDLLYPLLLGSSDAVANTLAQYYGKNSFVRWMNSQAKALDMTSTTFADASGASVQNVSTPEDLYRLAVYLANKKSFVWKITRTPQKTITATDGSTYTFTNSNQFTSLLAFVGGKAGTIAPTQDTMVSVFSLPIGGQERRVAVIVLDSSDYSADTQKLATWFDQSATAAANTACVSCVVPQTYKKIQL